MSDQKRNRKTRKEMIEVRKAQLEKLIAQEEGNFQDDQETSLLKSLQKRLSKTKTALRSAAVIIHGVTKADGKGWVSAPVAEKIEKTRKRLADQVATGERAEIVATTLLFDKQLLETSIAAIEAGDTDVEFPTDLHSLNGDGVKTDEEVEADFIAKEEATEV